MFVCLSECIRLSVCLSGQCRGGVKLADGASRRGVGGGGGGWLTGGPGGWGGGTGVHCYYLSAPSTPRTGAGVMGGGSGQEGRRVPG